MTKRNAALRVASRNPEDYIDDAAGMCSGIKCKDCFYCHAIETLGMDNAEAAVYVKQQAIKWLKDNPE